MDISPLRLNNCPAKFESKCAKNKCNNDFIPQQKKEVWPTTMQYLAFTGGKSLDLALTSKQIEKFGSFPCGI